MLNEEKEDKGDKEDYRRNLTVKPDHGLEQPQEICKEPAQQEIRHAIQRMRNNRAPGEDTFVAELIKYREGVMDAGHELTKFIWTTENMPWESNTGIICLIYKKGDKLEGNNYRGVTLLNNTYKIFSSILNERLKIVTEKIIGEYQCGFR
jgi:sorting nexin-29